MEKKINPASFLEDLVNEIGDSRDLLNLTEYEVGDEVRVFEAAITREKEPLLKRVADVEQKVIELEALRDQATEKEQAQYRAEVEAAIEKGKKILDELDVAIRLLSTWDPKKVYKIVSVNANSVHVALTEEENLELGFLDIYKNTSVKLKF